MIRRLFGPSRAPLLPALVLLVAVAAVAAHVAFRIGQSVGERLVRERMAELEAAGIPVSFPGLGSRYHDRGLPSEENAAPLLLEAFENLDADDRDLRDLAGWTRDPQPLTLRLPLNRRPNVH